MPTAAQLKQAIDRGRTRAKVDNIDPAAAPLGTDDEAAVNLALRTEVTGGSEEGPADRGVAIYVLLIAV